MSDVTPDAKFPAAAREDSGFVFVCYSHRDSELVYPDIELLNQDDVPVWYDQGISPASDWSEELATKIDNCELFIFFASRNSVESNHCRNECVYALDKKKPILTVFLEEFELPPGLKLSLGASQAMNRYQHNDSTYQARLLEAVKSILEGGVSSRTPQQTPATRSSTVQVAGFAAVFALLAVVATFLFLAPDEGEPPAGGVAILPFTAEDGSTRYGDRIVSGLSGRPGIQVSPKNDVLALLGEGNLSSGEISRQLGARYLLGGQLTSNDSGSTLSVFLTDTNQGFNVWTDDYQLTDDNLSALISANIAEAVAIYSIEPTADDLEEAGTNSVEAYRAYRLARYHHLSWNPTEIDIALHYYDRAIELDENFYKAYNGLATSLSDSRFILPSQETINIAKASIKRIDALDLSDPNDSRYGDLFILHLVDWNLKELEQLLRDGINSGHANPRLYGIYGFWVLRPSGRVEQAIEFINYADAHTVTRDAYDRASILLWQAHTYSAIGDFSKSDRAIQGCYKVDPRNLLCRTLGFLNAIQAGQVERAMSTWQEAQNYNLSPTVKNTGEMFLAAATGNQEEMIRLLQLLESDPDAIPFYIGFMYMQLGDLDKGFDWWEFAYDVRDPNLLHNLYFGNLLVPEPLKAHPRYTALISKVGVTAEWNDKLGELMPELPKESFE